MNDILEDLKKYLEFQQEISGGKLFLDLNNFSFDSDFELEQVVKDEISFEEEEIIMPTKKSSVKANWNSAESLPILYDKIHNCQECKLGATRTKFVFGAGNPNADIMVIGEAPGHDEDLKGEPFVGRAGQLLTNILAAINLSRDDIYIANIIKCRPPENRRPEKEEIEQCEPYLQKQIDLIKPKFILALGLTAVDALLKTKNKMGDIRGKILTYRNTTMLATYHPAALLRNPNWKKDTWQDVKQLRKLYDDYLAEKED